MATSSFKGKKKGPTDPTSNRAITDYFLASSSSPGRPGPSHVQSQPSRSRSRSFARGPSASVSTFAALPPAALNGAPPIRVRPKAGPARMPSSPQSNTNLPEHLQKKFPRNLSSSGGRAKAEPIDLTMMGTPPPPPAQKGDRGRSPITVSSNTSRADSLKRSHYSISSDHSSDVVALDSPPQLPPAKRPKFKVKIEGKRQVSATANSTQARVSVARNSTRLAAAARVNAAAMRSATAPNPLLPATVTSSDESDNDGVPFTPKVRRVQPKPQAQAKPRMPLSTNNSTILPPSHGPSHSGAVAKVKEFSPSQLQNLSPANLSQRRTASSAGRSRHSHSHSPNKAQTQDLPPTFNHDVDFNFAGDDGPSFMEVDDPIPPASEVKTATPTPDLSRKTVTPTARTMAHKTPIYRTPPRFGSSVPRAKSVASPRTPSMLVPQPTSSLPEMLRGVGATPPSSPPPSAISSLPEQDLLRSASRRLSKTPSRRQSATPGRRSMSLTPGQRLLREIAAGVASDDSDDEVDFDQVMRDLDDASSLKMFDQDPNVDDVVSDSEPEDQIPRAQLAAQRPSLVKIGSLTLRERCVLVLCIICVTCLHDFLQHTNPTGKCIIATVATVARNHRASPVHTRQPQPIRPAPRRTLSSRRHVTHIHQRRPRRSQTYRRTHHTTETSLPLSTQEEADDATDGRRGVLWQDRRFDQVAR